MNEIVLTREQTDRLAGGGETVEIVNGQVWRLAHESFSSSAPPSLALQASVDRYVSLSAAEVNIIAHMSEGLIIGDTTIRSEVAR